MPELEIDYERYLIYYKELLFGKKFESKKRNRVTDYSEFILFYIFVISNIALFIKNNNKYN